MTFEDWMVSVYQGQHAFTNLDQAFRSAWDAAAAAEREACAEVCDYLLANPHTGGGWSDATIEATATIRARGKQE